MAKNYAMNCEHNKQGDIYMWFQFYVQMLSFIICSHFLYKQCLCKRIQLTKINNFYGIIE